ncbi:MAG TPA: glycoside hydrolase family 16 protein [Rhizomicrobium sp.]|nr:glycoside hydrolase family 16 protein [Rhizomicrobium sp.]
MATLLALSAAPARASEAPLSHAPDGRRLVLTFKDDFNDFRMLGAPSGVWRTTFGDGAWLGMDGRTLPNNGELELYVDPLYADAEGAIGLDPFAVRDGHLEIRAAPTPRRLLARLAGHRYVSGMISSQPTFRQTYGYFEMRAKIPSGRGLWPAFWLLPADLSWPPEIDVMESVGDASRIYSTAHSNLRPAVDIDARVAADAFHSYAVSWDPRMLVWYVDGRKIGEEPTPPDLNKPMYMIANLAVGGDWPGAPDKTTAFPAILSIDYIRAYRFADE